MKNEAIQRFRDILAENNQSVTGPRLTTFSLLVGSKPQSMGQLIAATAGKVDRVSVYRHIELFETLGIVKKIHIGWKYKVELSDIFTGHHHHLMCLGCGKVVDIEDEKHIESFVQSVAEEQGFTVRGHQFEIEGYCNACASKK